MVYSVLLKLIEWVLDTVILLMRGQRTRQILFIGLENSGKSTLVHLLKHNEFVIVPPTYSPTLTTIRYNRRERVEAFEHFSRGHDLDIRSDCQLVDCVFITVDASDPERFGEVKDKIRYWLGAIDEGELGRILGLEDLQRAGLRVKLALGSTLLKKGVQESFDWVVKSITRPVK